MTSLAKRIAALEMAAGMGVVKFIGLLEYDARTQTHEDAAKGATEPGLYLVLECMCRNAGELCCVKPDGAVEWEERAHAT